jgi:hypothetical protein
MPSPDQSASPFRAAASLPVDRRYGGRIVALDQLPIHALGDNYTVDGNGTVTSLPSLPIGETVILRMTGAPTFTNSARLICPGNLDYKATAGDAVIARSDGDGVWRLIVLPSAPANEVTLVQGDIPQTPSFDVALPSGYDEIVIELRGFGTTSDQAAVVMTVSTDGTAFPTSGYSYVGNYMNTSAPATFNGFGSASASNILCSNGLPLGGVASSTVRIRNPGNAAAPKLLRAETDQQDTSAHHASFIRTTGQYETSNAAIVAVRFQFSGGTSPAFTAGGTYTVRGIKKK